MHSSDKLSGATQLTKTQWYRVNVSIQQRIISDLCSFSQYSILQRIFPKPVTQYPPVSIPIALNSQR